MPKIISYTPSWLSRPNSGFQVFEGAKSQRSGHFGEEKLGNGDTDHSDYIGPNRTVAHRGAEIFVVVGTQIRWADLSLLKEGYEQLEQTPSKVPAITNGHSTHNGDDGPEDGSYRVLKVGSIHGPIRQISISASGKLLAIATSHTVHLAILPDSSHLGQLPNKSIKLKTSTIGRTIHVVSQSPIASILWHPCGVAGSCLVTVTADAAVRLWEFNEGNRYASDTPSLAIDLKKLALGTSEQEDFSPDRGKNRAFSSDAAGMEVASASFGGTGSNSESPWSAMTLWIAMRAGDIYALCPLCPLKWQAPSIMLPSLSTTAVAKAVVLQDNGAQDSEESRQYKDQYTWIQEVDGQEPMYAEAEDDFGGRSQIYSRPERPFSIPKLQGPFQLTSEESGENSKEEDFEISDIRVIAARIDHESLDSGDDSDSEPDLDDSGLSATLVCLLNRNGRVYICLDLEGVEAQWLPRKKSTGQLTPSADPYLVLLEGLDTLNPNDINGSEWPTFSADVESPYSFFTTHSKGVFFFSLDPWLSNLEKELRSTESTGISFRLDIFRNGPGSLRERMLSFNQSPSLDQSIANTVPSCVALDDSDLGYLLLTTCNNHPYAAILDRPYATPVHDYAQDDEDDGTLPDMQTLAIGPVRSAYQPADAFYASSELLPFIDRKVPTRHKHLFNQQIRLSPATLDVMTEAHRVLSHETHGLGVAAADLFRRCERLIDELKDQIGRVHECAVRTGNVVADGDDGERFDSNGDAHKGKQSLEARVQSAREKQATLQERHEALKRKVHGAGGRKLSEKEKAWAEEVERTDEAIREGRLEGRRKPKDGSDGEDGNEDEEENEGEYDADGNDDDEHSQEGRTNGDEENAGSTAGAMRKRLQEVQDLKDSLLEQASEVVAAADETLPQNRPQDESTQLAIPRDLKARKMAQVMALLERETTMVDAASKRLEKLSVGVVSQS